MGSQGSKAAAAERGGAKANGQENGHVRLNGDMTPKVGAEAAPLNGTGSAEPLQEESRAEAGDGDAIEPAPPTEGTDAKPEGAAAPKDTPKKKKKFSFKKSFKLSGISFRKNKKEAGDSSGSSPTEEQGKAESKGEENPTGGTEPSAPPEEVTTEKPGSQSDPAADGQGTESKSKREDGEAGGNEEDEEKQQKQQAGENQADAAKPAEPCKPTEAEPPAVAAQQKEE